MTREAKFNLLRGCVIGAYLDREEKEELLEFVRELEEGAEDECN